MGGAWIRIWAAVGIEVRYLRRTSVLLPGFKEASLHIIFEDMFMEVRDITTYVPPLKMGVNGLLRSL